jgi:hypothetical protein
MAAPTFVDPSGAPIANGIMVVSLNADAMSSLGQVYSQNTGFALDSTGTPDVSAVKLLSSLTNNYDSNNAPAYSVIVYNALGERVWGPSIPGNPALPSPLQ